MVTVHTDVIVGSGPTAYAAALGVLSAGRHPAIIDFGSRPGLRSSSPRGAATLARKSNTAHSDPFAYPRTLVASQGPSLLPLSSVRGGLSTVWGAGVLIRDRHDIPELSPVGESIARGYEALVRWIPLAGERDRISDRFPWPATTLPTPCSKRFEDVRLRASSRTDSGVLVGSPRLALDASACVRCGECLTGCPDKLFFSSADGFENLFQRGLCEAIVGPVVRLERSKGSILLETPTGSVHAERVYVAAGPIATPALLQRSGLASETLFVRDSAVFYVAILNSNQPFGDEQEFTAAQLMVAAGLRGTGDFALSVYESNSEFRDRFAALLRMPARLIPYPKIISQRLNAGIGSLPPSVSGKLQLDFRAGRTWVRQHKNTETRAAALRAVRRAASALLGLNLRPMGASVIVPEPGSSYHCGSSLPMGGEEVRWDGSLHAAPQIYVVDASSLPTLWPGSHTFTAMANAYRIAEEAV